MSLAWAPRKRPNTDTVDVLGVTCPRCARRAYVVLPPASASNEATTSLAPHFCRGCDEVLIECYCPRLPASVGDAPA